MPHPEHAVEPLIGTGRTDGLAFFTSVLKKLVSA
jgi:phosphoribosylformylglycinamidine synthase